MSEPAYFIENEWYVLNEVLGQEIPASRLGRLQKEVLLKSEQIKRDLKLRFSPILLEDHGSGYMLRAAGIAGTLQLFGKQFQVVPKVLRDAAATGLWQSSLLLILNRTRRKQFTYIRARHISIQHISFIDHVALAYSDSLESALNLEAIHVYKRREEQSPYLRGHFAISRQLRSVLVRPHLLECDVDYLDTDNQFNHLLRWAGERFLALVYEGEVRRHLQAVLEKMPRLAGPASVPAHLPVKPPAQYSHFLDALEIASLLARGYGHGQRLGHESGYGYVLNMEKVFETFIEKTLIHVARTLLSGFAVKPQDSRLYALSEVPGTKSYFTRPDNVIYKDGRSSLIVDAKYKKFSTTEGLEDRPQNEDVYQLFASMVAHGCYRGLLLYPRLINDTLSTGAVKRWTIKALGNEFTIAAASVDFASITSAREVAAFDQRFLKLIEELVK